jgi:hypothetical protein
MQTLIHLTVLLGLVLLVSVAAHAAPVASAFGLI